MDPQDSLPFEYHAVGTQTRFGGEPFGEKIRATVCRLNPRAYVRSPLRASLARATPTEADFRFQAKYEDYPAAEFVLRYTLSGAAVLVSMLELVEHDGFELIDVAMPSLASLCETDGAVWLAHGNDGGSFARLAEAKEGQLAQNRFWGKVLANLPLVMIGTEKAICVLETTSYMDGMELAVTGPAGQRYVSWGTVKNHRVSASLCYDLNMSPPNPRNCGNAKTPNLLVGQPSLCR